MSRRDLRLLIFLAITLNLIVLVMFERGNRDLVKGDFKMYYTAAVALRTGHTADVYDPSYHDRAQRELMPSITPRYIKSYTHPPYELLIFLPFSLLGYQVARVCWLVVSLGLAALCGRLLRSYAAVFALFPLVLVLFEQQDSLLTLLALIGCWFAIRRGKDALGGFILGLALFRFPIIVPLAAILFLWRPRILRGLLISGSVVVILSVALVGPDGMRSYIRYVHGMASSSVTAVNDYYKMDPRHNPTLRGLVYQVASGGGETVSPRIAPLIPVATGILYLGALVFAWKVMRSKAQPEVKYSAAILVALLLSFHLLVQELILLALPLVLLRGFKAQWALAPFCAAPFVLLFYPDSQAWLALLLVAAAMFAYAGSFNAAFRMSQGSSAETPRAISAA